MELLHWEDEVILNFDLTTIYLLSDLLILLLVSLLTLFSLRAIAKVKQMSEGSVRLESHKISKIVEGEIRNKLDKLFDRLERDLAKQLEEIDIWGSQINRDLSDFAKKQQESMIEESQVLVANSFSRIQKQLEEYKKNQLIKIDKQIREIILDSAREVLGRSISFSEHEDLVQQALEKARKDQFFQ